MEQLPEQEIQLHWYAMKVFYNKVFEMEDLLNAYGIETYIATQSVEQKGKDHSLAAKRLADESDAKARRMYYRSGPMIFKREPLVSSLLFLRADEEKAAMVQKMLVDEDNRTSKGFIYSDKQKKSFSVIPDKQMEIFRMVTSHWKDDMLICADGIPVPIGKGDKVRVTDGPMAGAEGYIKRIGKDRRLLVCIEGVIAIATSYIPKQMLEKVEE